MLDPAALIAEIAVGFSAAFGGPFHAAQIVDQAGVQHDAGGDIIPGGTAQTRGCLAQIDSADWAMRQDKGFVEGQMKCIILSATLEGDLGADATLTVLAGPHVGTWLVSSISRDPLGTQWVGRGVAA